MNKSGNYNVDRNFAEQKAAMDNCAAKVEQMVADARQTDEAQREIQKGQRENDLNIHLRCPG